MPDKTLAEIVAVPQGTKPWYTFWKSLAEWVLQHAGDIGALQAGSPPGWNAAIDTRWYVADTSASATTYTGITVPAATGADALPTGYEIIFKPATTNTGAATLNVGSAEAAKPIEKYEAGSLVPLVAGDIIQGNPMHLVYKAGIAKWILLNAPSGGLKYSNIVASTTLATGKDYNDSAGASNVHTLPLLSTTTAGDKLRLYLSGTDRVVIINHNASDSGGAEVWREGNVGKSIELTSTGTAWVKSTQARGIIVQKVFTRDGSVATGTTIIPGDNTIPQNTEGNQYMSRAITPTNINNSLLIEVDIHLSHSAIGHIAAALFQDAIAGALAISFTTKTNSLKGVNLSFKYEMAAGTVAATTFKVRGGCAAAGTTTFNGVSGAGLYGGVLSSSITITEYTP